MLTFNELRIDSNKHLIIDIMVTTGLIIDEHQAVYINKVGCGFGTKTELVDLLDEDIIAIIENSQSSSYSVLAVTDDGNNRPREIRYDLDLTDSVIATIFNCTDCTSKLVYIEVQIDYSEVPFILSLDCSMFKDVISGYAYDRCILTNGIFNLIKTTGNRCDNLSDLANYIIQVKGLELAIESGNFSLANSYWNEFFSNNKSLISNNRCSCHR